MTIRSVGPEIYLPLQQLIPQQRQFVGQNANGLAPAASAVGDAGRGFAKPAGPVDRFGPAVASFNSGAVANQVSGQASGQVSGGASRGAGLTKNPLNSTSEPMSSLAPPADGRGLYLDISA